ncbi:Hypothetical_protein [Hexamita inflata]|uniref:Hypothetical_protein n=1 Tax=Hexamita inflata TaxID=28002 RepID=A0AA86QQB5_9EUKA|nr:Hypothetical protein HINF_LOCUS44859 [Hexamita inflata]
MLGRQIIAYPTDRLYIKEQHLQPIIIVHKTIYPTCIQQVNKIMVNFCISIKIVYIRNWKRYLNVLNAHINILLSQLASDRSLNVENVVNQLYNQILQVFRADFQLFTNKIQSELIIQFCLRYAYGSTEIPSKYFNCKTFSEDHKLDYAIFITQNTIEGTITYKFMDQLFCDFVLFYDFATKNQQHYFLAACFSGLTNKHIYNIMNSQQYQTNFQEFQNYWSKAYNQCEQQYWTQIIEICALSDLEYKKKQLKISNSTYNKNLNELVTNLKQNSVKVFILIRNILDHINDNYVSQERFNQVLELLSKCFQNKMLKIFYYLFTILNVKFLSSEHYSVDNLTDYTQTKELENNSSQIYSPLTFDDQLKMEKIPTDGNLKKSEIDEEEQNTEEYYTKYILSLEKIKEHLQIMYDKTQEDIYIDSIYQTKSLIAMFTKKLAKLKL